MKSPYVLGILGGLGPLCGASFYHHIITYTDAKCDAEHIPVLLDGCSQTPDRSAFLCHKSALDPTADLRFRLKRLCENGADLIAIPCNTAHCFYRALAKESPIPILHIVTETVAQAIENGVKKVGILGTEATVQSGLYEKEFASVGIPACRLCPSLQADLDALIRAIKAGIAPSPFVLSVFENALFEEGCDAILLGCTELSLCYSDASLPRSHLDSLRILAKRCVLACGKPLSQSASQSTTLSAASVLIPKETTQTEVVSSEAV